MAEPETKLDLAAREALRATHPSFMIYCRNCGSENVGIDSSVGFSSMSGAWGSVDLLCADCGQRDEIWEACR